MTSRNQRPLIAALIIILIAYCVGNVWGQSLYYSRIIQGTKYNLGFIEGAIDPADPMRGYIELDLTTFQRLDVVVAARHVGGPDRGQRYQTRRINASTGTPRKVHFTFYLDQLGLDAAGKGLMTVIFLLPMPTASHNVTVAYRVKGDQVRFNEVAVPLE